MRKYIKRTTIASYIIMTAQIILFIVFNKPDAGLITTVIMLALFLPWVSYGLMLMGIAIEKFQYSESWFDTRMAFSKVITPFFAVVLLLVSFGFIKDSSETFLLISAFAIFMVQGWGVVYDETDY